MSVYTKGGPSNKNVTVETRSPGMLYFSDSHDPQLRQGFPECLQPLLVDGEDQPRRGAVLLGFELDLGRPQQAFEGADLLVGDLDRYPRRRHPGDDRQSRERLAD